MDETWVKVEWHTSRADEDCKPDGIEEVAHIEALRTVSLYGEVLARRVGAVRECSIEPEGVKGLEAGGYKGEWVRDRFPGYRGIIKTSPEDTT